jgi:hypothetical protein
MKKQRAVNTHRSTTDLNIAFYDRYDENFLFNKALALWFVCQGDETINKKFKDFTAGYGMSGEDGSKRTLSLRAEVYFSVFLQFEALFALLIAKFQAEPHWLYLTNYTTIEIKENVRAFLSNDISKITNGLVDNMDDFISQSVYVNQLNPENNSESVAAWQVNLKNIAYILKLISRRYIDDLTEYNGYKHGLRITRANDVEFRMPGMPPRKFLETIGYIDFEDDGGGSKVTVEVIKTISPEQSFYEMYLMQRMLRIIKLFRLAELKDELPPVNQDTPPEMYSFWDLDKRRLKERERFHATLNV